ncbi:TPA: SGNH hydrolase domain-containing protein [Legionella pneumophila]
MLPFLSLFFRQLYRIHVILIDPTKIICDKSKCYTSINGTPLYFDEGANSHLNYDGSTLIGKLYLKKFGNPFQTKNSIYS